MRSLDAKHCEMKKFALIREFRMAVSTVAYSNFATFFNLSIDLSISVHSLMTQEWDS